MIINNTRKALGLLFCLAAPNYLICNDLLHTKIPLEDQVYSIHVAAQIGSIETFNILLKRDPALDLNKQDRHGYTPLRIAISYNNADLVQWLLEHGADASLEDDLKCNAFHYAAKTGSIRILDLLFQHCPDLNINLQNNSQDKDDETPLMIAAKHRTPEIMRWFLEHGADVFIKDNFGNTVLHYAAEGLSSKSLSLLFEYYPNYDIDAQDLYGRTPAMNAAFNGNIESVSWLLEHGANPCAEDIYGTTLLHYAAASGSIEIADILLQYPNFEINKQNKGLATPLTIATVSKQTEFIQWLLDHGANPAAC